MSQREFAERDRASWEGDFEMSGDFWHDTDSSHLRRHGIRSRCRAVCERGTSNEKCSRCLLMWTKLCWEKLETVVFLLALGGVTILLV